MNERLAKFQALMNVTTIKHTQENFTTTNKPKNIKEVFDDEFPDFIVDKNLIQRLNNYLQNFKTRNSEHINFFGSGLLGVYFPKWLNEDKELWWDYVLQYDGFDIERRVHALPTVNTDFIRASDINNLSMVWCIHRIQNSNLSEEVKMQGKVLVFQILQIKFFTSFINHSWNYPTQENIALMVYNSLSLKYEIKVHGTWGNLIQARSETLASRNSIFFNVYTHMDNDKRIGDMVTDIQGRSKEIVKNLNRAFYSIKDDIKMSTTSNTMNVDGQEILKDTTRALDSYLRYINNVIIDLPSLVKREITQIIEKIVPSSNPQEFFKVLKFLNYHYGDTKSKYMEEFIQEVIIFSFEFMRKNNIRSTDLAKLLERLRFVIMASKNTDPSLIKIKKLGDQIVLKTTDRKTKAPPAPDRTALILYIVARTLTMKFYS